MPWESRSSFPDSLLADHMHGQNIADCYAAARAHLRYCFINTVTDIGFRRCASSSTRAWSSTSPRGWLPQTYEMQWRGSRRKCEILIRNVREMNPEEFRNSEGLWRIVIDWPFDEPRHTPLDDLAQVRNFKTKGEPADTIVWLPWFFTESTLRDLGRLVLLDQVLIGNRLNEYEAHLSQTDRRQLLGGDEHPEVGVLFGEIHRAVRARREERNRVFAAGVSEWLTGARGQGIVPIEHFLTRVVAPLGHLRPVLVLVLDGMDAGIFEELGESMYGRGWLRHRGAAPEAVLAVLPTVTESSRMALLTGGVKRGNAAAEKVGFARHSRIARRIPCGPPSAPVPQGRVDRRCSGGTRGARARGARR